MSLPDYQIEIRSPQTGDLVQVYDATAFYQLRYSRVLNDVGVIVLTLPSDDNLAALFPLDSLIEIKRTSPVTGRLIVEETFLTRMTHRFREGNEERFLVGGFSLNHLLTRRVVDPTGDPLVAGGFSTKSGPADSVMREYALEQGGQNTLNASRKFANFTVDTVPAVGMAVGRRLRYENLFKVFQELAEQSLIDFITVRTSANNLELQIKVIGLNRTQSSNYPFAPFVLINPIRGNMAEPSLMIDRRKETNFLYAMAQGAGENRSVYQILGDGVSDSPWNRIEFTEDIRTTERGSAVDIITAARAKLQETRQVVEFTFEITGDQPGNTYRLDWDIGDKITATWGDVQQDLRVRGVEITAESSGETIQVTTEIL